MLLDLAIFSGRLHPLVIHLPIGFLLLATLFELFSYSKKYEHLKASVSFTLLLGFISAVLACIFGYILSLSGDYESTALNDHKISGIILALISGLLFLISNGTVKKIPAIKRSVFTILCVLTMALMSYTGHQGGLLTHGAEYLSFEVLTQQERVKPASVEQAMIFEDVVHPILIQRCSQCHRPNKMKGELSVKTLADLQKGGKNGAAIVAGSLSDSELYKRITLDPEHEDYMPSDGKTPLTKSEVEIIQWWIEKGKAVNGKKLSELKNIQSISPLIASYLKIGGAGNNVESADPDYPVSNPDIPVFTNLKLLDSLRNQGLNIRVMQHQPLMLDITLPEGKGIRIQSIKPGIKSIAKNVIWLNLSANNLTDKDLDFLPLLINLEKLRLEKNPVTDKLIPSITALKHLEAVNLNETGMSKAGVEQLKKMPSVKRVYEWKIASAPEN
ncbi:MAG: hypothetical protein B7X86_01000 [Sphingobacteriales bacterium 17-39-43]|uniref:DUF2231 domain-containing protein n=1 Tax=Daejeonella sp. TaxID=2805397 RepID=UPI000BD73268|nr:DUF2231 domain-containing protein [Daejeonella sp.]OYZ32949.1 MAG: hypothetical protein B7Y24_01005 [Sphingobacteriales bacterium 16-39-50]OZA26359.1 MAG: hypothetical protein B7X86_01000 [Sphingobacteriales bacterium 17-39-43]HQT21488.1 hypothetical protein [Daejeonella sp.]HQT56219.1 hypothetical protein [Daejeonella sp.]